MNGNDYEEILDEAEDQYDDSVDLTESQMDQMETGGFPGAKEKSDLYNWFWKVVRLMEPYRLAKVGNLTSKEIGEHGISMRDSLNLAALGKTFRHKKFGEYWQERAMITSTTSMSKKGWFMDLSISQRKVRERAKSSTPTFEKSRLFGRKKKTFGQEEQ